MKRLILLSLLLLPVLVMSEELRDQRFDLSLSAAVALPGLIEASLEEGFPEESSLLFLSRVSPAVKLVAEYYLIPWLAPSIAVHYAALFLPQDIDLGYWDDRQHIIPRNDIHFTEVEAGIKYRVFAGGAWTVEPGLYFGYCHTFSSSLDARNNGFIMDVATEIQRHFRRYHLVSTVGFMMQWYGGVKDLAYIRSYPVVYAALGVGI